MKHPGRTVNIHRDLCLCGSGRLMRDCCLFVRCATTPPGPRMAGEVQRRTAGDEGLLHMVRVGCAQPVHVLQRVLPAAAVRGAVVSRHALRGFLVQRGASAATAHPPGATPAPEGRRGGRFRRACARGTNVRVRLMVPRSFMWNSTRSSSVL